MTAPLQHRVNASSAIFPLSGAAPSPTWKLNVTPSLDHTLSAGLETWSLACCADEMNQIQSRSHTQVPSLYAFYLYRSFLLPTFFPQRSYHARKKPAPGPSHPPNAHTMQQQTSVATQSTPSSSQTPPPTATSTLSAVTAAPGTTGTISRPNVTIRQAGWGIRFMLWATCASVEYTVNQP